MPKYVIERTVPGAGQIEAVAGLAEGSDGVLRELGPEVQWIRASILTAETLS
jgi:hypothetical protein